MSLKDMAPPTSKVGGISVYGISLAGIAMLTHRFPWWLQIFGIKGEDGQLSDFKATAMKSPALVAAIIAAGTGDPGDEECEKIASQFGIERQFDFIEAILKETVPSGAGPFVDRLRSYVIGVSVQQDATSLKNSGTDSISSSARATRKTTAGASHLDA